MSNNHGSTPAAWTGVAIVMVGFLVGSIGLMIYSMPTFIVGLVLMPLGGIVGLVMSKAAKKKKRRPTQEARAAAHG